MKYLLALLLAAPFLSNAQDCKLRKQTDAMTSKPMISTGFTTFNNIRLSIEAGQKEIDFFFVIQLASAKCVNEESTVSFLFEGGKTKSVLRNAGTMNCDGIIHLIMKNSATYTPSALQRLNSKKIIGLQLTDSNEKVTNFELTAEQQQILNTMISCIAKEHKSVM